eukprot:3282871-Pyramimonas_sp.AAC.1
MGEHGALRPTPEASAEALRPQWGEVFCEMQEDRAKWPELLPIVQQVPVGANASWEVDYETFFGDIIQTRKHSMPGPDGIPGHCWRLGDAPR